MHGAFNPISNTYDPTMESRLLQQLGSQSLGVMKKSPNAWEQRERNKLQYQDLNQTYDDTTTQQQL